LLIGIDQEMKNEWWLAGVGVELFDTANRELLVRVADVGKRFGDFVALHPLNVKVYSGEFFGVFGPNGAGKSTFIKLLTGQLKPTMGQVEVLGIVQTGPENQLLLNY